MKFLNGLYHQVPVIATGNVKKKIGWDDREIIVAKKGRKGVIGILIAEHYEKLALGIEINRHCSIRWEGNKNSQEVYMWNNNIAIDTKAS